MPSAQPPPMTFDEFFPSYLEAHSKRATRLMHAGGLLAALTVAGVGVATLRPRLFLLALAVGYLPAWCSHWFIERNTPKTFGQPLLSFRGDFLMVWRLLTGRL
ncbi:MAG: DUF962 domain-containing protein [Candidatus Eremiobacteraeota bacterium]|nr:DUF962 domain-containing protein [Candidatus Eremiobacteraeota bacterium]